jgi:hypothetical protein
MGCVTPRWSRSIMLSKHFDERGFVYAGVPSRMWWKSGVA